MKKLPFILLACFLSFFASAQEAETTESESSSDSSVETIPMKTTGFGGPTVQLLFLNGQTVPIIGGIGGALFSNQFSVGGFGLSTIDPISLDNQNINPNTMPASADLEMAMGGGFIGYTPWAEKQLHPIFGLEVGFGSFDLTDPTTGTELEQGAFTNVMPRAGVEMNIAPWFKFNVAGGYRLYQGIQNDFMDNSALNSPMAELRLHFGWFGK